MRRFSSGDRLPNISARSRISSRRSADSPRHSPNLASACWRCSGVIVDQRAAPVASRSWRFAGSESQVSEKWPSTACWSALSSLQLTPSSAAKAPPTNSNVLNTMINLAFIFCLRRFFTFRHGIAPLHVLYQRNVIQQQPVLIRLFPHSQVLQEFRLGRQLLLSHGGRAQAQAAGKQGEMPFR